MGEEGIGGRAEGVGDVIGVAMFVKAVMFVLFCLKFSTPASSR